MLNLKQIVSAIKGSNPFCTKDVKEQSKANKLDRQFKMQLEVIMECVALQSEVIIEHQDKIDLILKTITPSQVKLSNIKTAKSGYKGVYHNGKKWTAAIWKNNKQVHLGVFEDPKEAHKAYCKEFNKLMYVFKKYLKRMLKNLIRPQKKYEYIN